MASALIVLFAKLEHDPIKAGIRWFYHAILKTCFATVSLGNVECSNQMYE